MGHGIAGNLVRRGWPLLFLGHPGNQPVDDLLAAGAQSAGSAADLAARSDVVILVVTGAPEVEAVLTGPGGVLDGLRPGATVIDCSTSLPGTTREMARRVEDAGARFLDAPMTRTPKEAAEGRLNLIVGGDRAVLDAHRPILESFAENIVHAGDTGSGHALKLLHNFVSLGFSAVLIEAAAAARASGVDAGVFCDVLAQGGGRFAFGLQFGALEQRLHLRMGEDLGQRPPCGRARQRRRGIVLAQLLIDEEAVELPQGRGFSRHGGWRQPRPCRAQLFQRRTVRDSKIAEQFLRSLEVTTIGGKRVCGSAALGGQHGEEVFYRRGHRPIVASGKSPGKRVRPGPRPRPRSSALRH